ncbi:MAG: glutamate 5-kinase [Planctomycetota bacterium]|jgi:glutamate 5-kinase|nr:glutamate 5-kinase [Planctomycetota bacterium]
MTASQPDSSRGALATAARLIVVKVGTRVLTRPDGLLDTSRIESLGHQFDTLLAAGKQVILVSSGAVGAGMGRMGLSRRPAELAHLQAMAAIGQSGLIEAYERVLRAQGRHVAQVLLVADDFKDRARYLNIRNTLRALLDYQAIPIINENDTVSVEELKTSFGDNDRLAALVATLLGAPLLVLLSDVDGLYNRHPDEPGAAALATVPHIDTTVEALARDRAGGLSKGGMASKIAAARIVTESGGHCIIASGRDDDVLPRIMRGETVGTLFPGRTAAMPAWKRWLGWSADVRGTVTVDAGARDAVVATGRSLLAAGVRTVDGTFTTGDLVALSDAAGNVFARGLVNYSAAELQQIRGLKTDRIAAVLGYCPYDEVIHRDNLAVIRRDGSTNGSF